MNYESFIRHDCFAVIPWSLLRRSHPATTARYGSNPALPRLSVRVPQLLYAPAPVAPAPLDGDRSSRAATAAPEPARSAATLPRQHRQHLAVQPIVGGPIGGPFAHGLLLRIGAGCFAVVRLAPANEKRQKFANLPKTGSLASYDVIFPDLTGGGEPCPR